MPRHTGAHGTELRRKFSESDKLLAIASWDSKATRDGMEGDHDVKIDEIIRSAAPLWR
ncbi:hypothetical protein [Microbulbifer aestuariivivens]